MGSLGYFEHILGVGRRIPNSPGRARARSSWSGRNRRAAPRFLPPTFFFPPSSSQTGPCRSWLSCLHMASIKRRAMTSLTPSGERSSPSSRWPTSDFFFSANTQIGFVSHSYAPHRVRTQPQMQAEQPKNNRAHHAKTSHLAPMSTRVFQIRDPGGRVPWVRPTADALRFSPTSRLDRFWYCIMQTVTLDCMFFFTLRNDSGSGHDRLYNIQELRQGIALCFLLGFLFFGGGLLFLRRKGRCLFIWFSCLGFNNDLWVIDQKKRGLREDREKEQKNSCWVGSDGYVAFISADASTGRCSLLQYTAN
ncbi:hypothetical protein VTH06DRAFT_1443 [Thermothelomyces fergusii]